MRRWPLLGLPVAITASLVLASCSSIPAPAAASPTPAPPLTPDASQPSGQLVVFAASSLTEAFNEIKTVFRAKHPLVSIAYNFAGTPTLRTQLEQGARADVFASADEPQMNLAVRSGVIQGTPVVFAANKLVIVAPAASRTVQTPSDLARPGIKLVLGLKGVPVGGYARNAIAKMDASGEFGPDFARRTLANVVSQEPNVRQALSKVALGEADAAIVYGTDITPDVSARVRQLEIPGRFNVLARYPVGVVTGARQPAAAEEFIALLRSAGGRAILAGHGFGEAEEGP